jgi:hypothetical protein
MATRAKLEMMYLCDRLLRIVRLLNLPVSFWEARWGWTDHRFTEDLYA